MRLYVSAFKVPGAWYVAFYEVIPLRAHVNTRRPFGATNRIQIPPPWARDI